MLEKLKLELPPAAGNKLVLKLSPPPPPLADKQVSLVDAPTACACAQGISKWMTPSRSRRNNERKGASAPIDCSNGFGALLGAGGNEGSGSGTGNARSKVTRGSTPSTTNAGATVIVETTTITTPKICPLRLYFGILALICLGAASAHSSYSATTALLSSQWFDSSAMLAAPADAVGCDTPACQCEALKMVYLDLQISDIDTRFFRPGQADCCNLSAVSCNHHGGIKKLKLRGGTSTPSGVIPLEALKGLVELERLDLGNYRYSSISGTIPGSLAKVGNLRHLTLRNSSISGTIPDSLAKVGNLRHLTLTARRLSGTLPAELLGPGRLEELKVTGRISGTVPASYCKSASPQHHGSEVSYVCYVYRWPCPAMSTDNRGHPALHAGDRPLGETEIVLAYCSASLAWLMGTLDKLAQVGANVTRVNVVAKCGKKPRASELPRHATVETVENVGRNDHTFARFLAARYCTLPASILFLKDTSMGYEGGDETVLAPIGVTRLAQGLSASRDGFACGSHLAGTRRSRLWHVAVEADEFQMDDYQKQHDQNSKTQRANVDAFRAAQRPLRQFWRAVFSPATHARVDAARHAVRLVCYGGTFAATATAVRRTPRSDWIALRDALTRGDNIEEGHFAERLWAVLLSPSPSKSVVSAVLAGGAKAAMGKCGYCSKPFPGLLSKCDVAVLPPVPDDLSETEPDLVASSQADAPHVADGCAGTAASVLAASAPAAG